jgi:TrmH family RNA methyltransferase
MLTKAQQRLLLALQKRKDRERLGLFILEGEKFVKDARSSVEFKFGPRDTTIFREVVSTESPSNLAAVVKTPKWTLDEVAKRETVIVLDGVQDPGNVGTILRACLGFEAGLLLVESAEVTNPKTVRSSAGALLHVPWLTLARAEAEAIIKELHRPVYRLERRAGATTPAAIEPGPRVIVAGSEGRGIKLNITGQSLSIQHVNQLESLNVGVAVSIVLYQLWKPSS